MERLRTEKPRGRMIGSYFSMFVAFESFNIAAMVVDDNSDMVFIADLLFDLFAFAVCLWGFYIHYMIMQRTIKENTDFLAL